MMDSFVDRPKLAELALAARRRSKDILGSRGGKSKLRNCPPVVTLRKDSLWVNQWTKRISSGRHAGPTWKRTALHQRSTEIGVTTRILRWQELGLPAPNQTLLRVG